MTSRLSKAVLAIALALIPCALLAQTFWNADSIAQTVQSAGEIIRREYFDADLGARMDLMLRQNLAAGRYANATTPQALASILTDDLYSTAHDKHLSVVAPASTAGPYAGPGASQQSREELVRVSNAGVQRVEILPGNVGYFNLTAFFGPSEARDAIADAMRVLRHTDALIVDMRDNQGGSPDMVALVASYFFDASGLPLMDMTHRYGEPDHYSTQSGIVDRDGKRPVYVLVSAHTWSGGEGFAFILQERHRAEIIGETTVGAANGGRPYPINANFYVNVPNSQLRSAVLGTNWEGVGVQPDVAVPASDALRVAQDHALRQLLSATPDGPWRQQLDRELRRLALPTP